LHIQQQATANVSKSETKAASFNENGRVAFLGERGTFSEEAAIKLLGEAVKTVPSATFENLFAAIEDAGTDYILAPLENSLVDSVHRCYDLLLESSLTIEAEIILPISHFLIGCEGASIESIETVESHPVALAQCEHFFAAHPNIKRVATDDTASSVRRVIENGDLSRAANVYGGAILQEHLEDYSENYTRFVLLAPNPDASKSAGNKISLVVRLAHRPGSLRTADFTVSE
jgi:prephenate dehydratase